MLCNHHGTKMFAFSQKLNSDYLLWSKLFLQQVNNIRNQWYHIRDVKVKWRSNFRTSNYMFEFEYGIVTFNIRFQLALCRCTKWSTVVM